MTAPAQIPTAKEIMAATGITLGCAQKRLREFRAGMRSAKRLLAPKGQGRGYVGKLHDAWGDMSQGARKRLDDIPGTTELERRYLRPLPIDRTPDEPPKRGVGRSLSEDGIPPAARRWGGETMNDRCPVTGARATRMTRAGFARTCAAKRRERQGCDWVFTRCETCKGRPENWPPELTIITMEATMTAKKATKTTTTAPDTELLAKLQLDLRSREETLERLAGMLGCLPGDLEQAMAAMQAHVQAIRDIVEPEVAQYQCQNLPDACKQLAELCHWERERAEDQTRNLEEANERIRALRSESMAIWNALDGDVCEESTSLDLAKKRWAEIETLRGQLELARNTIKAREQDIEQLEEAAEAAASSPVQDGGEAANILHDLMRKLVDGRISLIHNHA